jgi:hypothetical protein
MMIAQRVARAVAATAVLSAMAACTQAGTLGNILGGVLAPSNAMQLSGTVQGVDTRSQVVSIAQSGGQTVAVNYDNRTKVVYQNQLYSITSLEYGDQVQARLTDQGNNTYYADSIFVTQPVNGSTNGGTINNGTNVQTLQGTVRSVDRSNGWFTIDASGGVALTVTLPYNASSQDVNRFNALRNGDFVRFYGVFLNNNRVELRQFY